MSVSPATLRAGGAVPADALAALYASVGWRAYLVDPDALAAAVAATPWVLSAWDGERLIGLLRALTDDLSIVYIQDLLVHPDRQRQGVGRQLMQATLDRFAHVRQKVLMTDDEPRQHAFYASFGFTSVRGLSRTPLHAFARIEGVELA